MRWPGIPLAHGHRVPEAAAAAAGGPSQGLSLQAVPVPSSDSLPRRLPQSAAFPDYSPVLCLSLLSAGAASLHCASPTSLHGLVSDPPAPHCMGGKAAIYPHSQQVGAGQGVNSGASHLSAQSILTSPAQKGDDYPHFSDDGATHQARGGLICPAPEPVSDHQRVSPSEQGEKAGCLLTATIYQAYPGCSFPPSTFPEVLGCWDNSTPTSTINVKRFRGQVAQGWGHSASG